MTPAQSLANAEHFAACELLLRAEWERLGGPGDGPFSDRCTCALNERKRIATLERELAEARAKVHSWAPVVAEAIRERNRHPRGLALMTELVDALPPEHRPEVKP